MSNIGAVMMPTLASPNQMAAAGVSRRDQAVNDFNALLMEMFVRQSGIASAFGGDESPDGAIVGDLMTQVFSSQLAAQFHLVTAADVFGKGKTAEAQTNE